MESPTHQQSQERPPLRPPIEHYAGTSSPQNNLKQTAASLRDSGLGYLQAKAELAAIEATEAAGFAKKKISVGLTTIFIGFFSYAIFLILLHGLALQFAEKYITQISEIITLNNSNTVLLIMMILHFLVLLIFLLKLSKRPQGEFFSLTKSELQKDKQWLAEINQSNEN